MEISLRYKNIKCGRFNQQSNRMEYAEWVKDENPAGKCPLCGKYLVPDALPGEMNGGKSKQPAHFRA